MVELRLRRGRPRSATGVPSDADFQATDAAIVARAKQDRQIFALLYRRYVDRVYRYCLRCLGDRDAAEDATSTVFAKALAALPTCRDDAFRSWLFAIAHNVITDTYRTRSLATPLADAADVADRDPSPESQALAADDARRIRTMLALLPDAERDLLELRLAGLTDAEIARALGRSHGAVRTSQYRAIRRLRNLIVDSEAEEARHDDR